jgi:hypothetical protein
VSRHPASRALSISKRGLAAARSILIVLGCALSAGLSFALVGGAVQSVSGDRMAPWIIGRAAGVSAYLLLVCVVLLGLVLSHPWRSRWARLNQVNRIRLHLVLSVFTLAFTALHVLVLATDRYAGVGWRGALVPLGAQYRPVATTLGMMGLWAGLLAGVTAALAGRLPARAWWPLHKVAISSLAMIWLHGIFGGGDTHALRWLYLLTAALVLALAISRYSARTAEDRLSEIRDRMPAP